MQEEIDLNESVQGEQKKLIDAAGAGRSSMSPDWLTQLGRLWGGKAVRPCDQPDCVEGHCPRFMHDSADWLFDWQRSVPALSVICFTVAMLASGLHVSKFQAQHLRC